MKLDRLSLSTRGQAILDRTIKLVNIQSVSRTPGEVEISSQIYEEISSWPYFRKHPDQLWSVTFDDGSLARNNVLALVQGEETPSGPTIVYLCHYDTVDIAEYKDLESLACDPLSLAEELMERQIPEEVRRDLESGEWLFGRGTADMKTGVSLLMELLRDFSERVQDFKGNILFLAVGDEEADSLGMLSAAKSLVEMAAIHSLSYIGAINTDVVSQLHDADADRRYMYLGSMGKIVPAVYVVGKSSHVGESLRGVDANDLLSRLTWRIDVNMDLVDRCDKLVTQPPISLKQTDLKATYGGEVPYEGFAYYNFLNYRRGPKTIVDLMKQEVDLAFKDCIGKLKEARHRYFNEVGLTGRVEDFQHTVLTYGELFDLVCEKQGRDSVEAAMDKLKAEMSDELVPDFRFQSLQMVRTLWRLSRQAGPAAVIFIVPPYYPPNDALSKNENFQRFNRIVSDSIKTFDGKTSYHLDVRPYFPYLSDASFCAYMEGNENRAALEHNMPCWNRGWRIDIDNVMQLNMPVFDMGVHGMDFHKHMERVHVPYSIECLPDLIAHTTMELLKKF